MCQGLWQGVVVSGQATINTSALHASIRITLVYAMIPLIVLCGLQVATQLMYYGPWAFS